MIIGEGDEANEQQGDDAENDAACLQQGRFILVFSYLADALGTDAQVAAYAYFCHLPEVPVVCGLRHVEKYHAQRINVCLRV